MLQREISARPEEYLRELRLAFPTAVEVLGSEARIERDDVALRVRWQVGPPRVIANLRLPTLFVEIEFTRGDADARARTLAHMDRAMQRGGG